MKTPLRENFFQAGRSPHPIWRAIDPNLVFPPTDVLPALLALLLTPTVSFSATLVQKDPPVRPADADSPILIWDIDLKQTLLRNFRTTDNPLKSNEGDQLPASNGLADLHASGSGEFTTDNLKFVLAQAHGPVTVFDLRQETHIFGNGFLQTTGPTLAVLRAKSRRTKLRGCNHSNLGAKSLFAPAKPSKNQTRVPQRPSL